MYQLHKMRGQSVQCPTSGHGNGGVYPLLSVTRANDPPTASIFTKDLSDVLAHATSEIASGSKLGIDATKKIPGEGFKRPWPPWPPLIAWMKRAKYN